MLVQALNVKHSIDVFVLFLSALGRCDLECLCDLHYAPGSGRSGAYRGPFCHHPFRVELDVGHSCVVPVQGGHRTSFFVCYRWRGVDGSHGAFSFLFLLCSSHGQSPRLSLVSLCTFSEDHPLATLEMSVATLESTRAGPLLVQSED
ncbi:hypothetical protein OF83DRAFT_620229 [Amylostereum chailletii]|nr:hypothetical protein OF83DRAFT_620229 [Amylostereum chailletii]